MVNIKREIFEGAGLVNFCPVSLILKEIERAIYGTDHVTLFINLNEACGSQGCFITTLVETHLLYNLNLLVRPLQSIQRDFKGQIIPYLHKNGSKEINMGLILYFCLLLA